MENQFESSARATGRMRRRWAWIAIVLLVAVIGIVWWARSGRETQQAVTEEGEHKTDPNQVAMGIEAQRNIKLAVERATTARVSETIQATGSVGPN